MFFGLAFNHCLLNAQQSQIRELRTVPTSEFVLGTTENIAYIYHISCSLCSDRSPSCDMVWVRMVAGGAFLFCGEVVLETDSRISCMLGKYFATEPHPQPSSCFLLWEQVALGCSGFSWTHCVSQVNLDLNIIPLQPSSSWDHRPMSQGLAAGRAGGKF